MFYIEPSDEEAAFAFTSIAITYLLAFDNTTNHDLLPHGALESQSNLGLITAGLAFSNFGIALDVAINKISIKSEDTYNDISNSISSTTTDAGDYIRLRTGFKFGSIDLTFGMYWHTFEQENDSHIFIQPHFNFASKVLKSEKAQVFIGLNCRIPISIFDEIEDEETGATRDSLIIAVIISPNLLAEMNPSENWIIFGGAALEWELFGLEYYSQEVKKKSQENTSIAMKTDFAYANFGLRFTYSHLSVEASIASDLYLTAWSDLIGNLGVFFIF